MNTAIRLTTWARVIGALALFFTILVASNVLAQPTGNERAKQNILNRMNKEKVQAQKKIQRLTKKIKAKTGDPKAKKDENYHAEIYNQLNDIEDIYDKYYTTKLAVLKGFKGVYPELNDWLDAEISSTNGNWQRDGDRIHQLQDKVNKKLDVFNNPDSDPTQLMVDEGTSGDSGSDSSADDVVSQFNNGPPLPTDDQIQGLNQQALQAETVRLWNIFGKIVQAQVDMIQFRKSTPQELARERQLEQAGKVVFKRLQATLRQFRAKGWTPDVTQMSMPDRGQKLTAEQAQAFIDQLLSKKIE